LQLADRLSEIYVYRIKLLHGGEMRRLAVADQCAFRHQGTPDTSADRGADNGVIQLELCTREISLARGNISLGLAPIGDRGLVLGLRCGLAVDQLFNALGLQIRLDQHRLRLRERGLGSIAFHLEADRVDAIEHVPGLHVGSLLERTFHHNSRNPRAHFGDSRRRDPTRQLPDVGPCRGLQRHDADLRGRGRRGCLRLVARAKAEQYTS
jgi:hypothetical protein